MLSISLGSVIYGEEIFEDMEEFGKAKQP